MPKGVYNLTWKHFKLNQDSSMKEMFSSNENADVTLVSDDKFTFPAHKFIISAGSSVFEDLLINNPHHHPMIYLNGVKKIELDSFLQLIYLGKTKFCPSRMEKFFEIVRDLQIKQLSQPLINNGEPKVKDAYVFDEISYHGDETKNMKDDDLVGEGDFSVQEEDISVKSYSCEKCETAVFNSMQELSLHRKSQHESTRFECENCHYKTSHLGHFKQHKSSVNVGVRYSCDICGYKTSKLSNLKQHKESIHESVIYSCDSCDYKSKHPSNLKIHKASMHEGVRYSCDICEYKTTKMRNLRQHKESIHEGVRYSCDICDYNASYLSNLTRHKESVHGKDRFSCDQCEYNTGWRSQLSRHKKKKSRNP